MGKAARANAARRAQTLVDHISEMGRPATPRETAWVNDLLRRPRVVVHRLDDETLRSAGMRPNNCHANSQGQAKLDPEGRARAVSGWWVQGPLLVLHSVVELDGYWQCVTPQAPDLPGVFEFIEDPAIVTVADGPERSVRHADGNEPPQILRTYPERHIAVAAEFHRNVASGLTPSDAFALIEPAIAAIMALPLPVAAQPE